MLVVTHQAVSACHRPITHPNGYGIITGENFVTRPHPRDPRTRVPARVSIPVSITKSNFFISITKYIMKEAFTPEARYQAWAFVANNKGDVISHLEMTARQS